MWFVQLTTQGGRTDRRRRLEAIEWPDLVDWRDDRGRGVRVSLITHERIPRPENRTHVDHYWRIEDYLGDKVWAPSYALDFDRKAVEAVKLR